MNEKVKAGILGILFIIAIFILANYLNLITLKDKTYQLNVKFNKIGSLTKSADVKFNGLKIGSVESFSIAKDYKIIAHIKINKKYKIPINSKFEINTSIMNNSWIEIKPSNEKQYYKNNANIEGQKLFTMQDFFKETKKLLKKGQKTLDNINNILTDPELIPALKKDVKLLGQTLYEIKYQVRKLSNQSSEAIKVVKNDLHILLTNLDYRIDKISNEVYYLSHNLNVMTMENKKDIRTIVKNIKTSSDDLKQTMSYIKEFVQDKEIKKDIKSSLKHIRKTAKKLNHIAKEVDEFVSDKKMKKDLKDAIKYTKDTMEAVSKFLSPIKKLNNKKEKGYKLTSWELESEWVYKERGPIMNLSLKLFPYNERFYILGIRDIGYANQWNAQLGNRFGKSSAYRVGIIESKVGFGYDYYNKEGNLLYNFDIYDPKYPRINFNTYFYLSKYLQLKLGIRDILHKSGRKPTISIFTKF